ncbi:maleylpyruvate isomerase family mycothiol-dependent enzyme [Oryzobacter telluris]|uniref:maleylpyruvate isomerase family mycothiol-dependent enzyme n=1 Tax=Oryzobacter telluris TaxID=3149179 RepID=UPI00370D09DF
MSRMTTAEADTLWEGIDDQRARTARLLEGLSADQWDQPSLCRGWTVRHVAAHLTGQQLSYGDALAFVARHPRMLRSLGLNAAIRDSAVILARELSTTEIVDHIRAGIGSRRHNAFVTPLETLTDILVHSQDIAIPLGVDLAMRPGPSATAATRRWDTRHGWMASVNRRLPYEGFRLTATDTDWSRGDGPEVAGPVGALLLLLTGRPAALSRLSGEGADALRSQVDRPSPTRGAR